MYNNRQYNADKRRNFFIQRKYKAAGVEPAKSYTQLEVIAPPFAGWISLVLCVVVGVWGIMPLDGSVEKSVGNFAYINSCKRPIYFVVCCQRNWCKQVNN